MKYCLYILFLLITPVFAGELEVEGDLTVTGEIQSPTIEALLAQIALLEAQIIALEAQIALMQDADNKLETRVYEYNLSMSANSVEYLDIQQLTGFNPSYANLSIANITELNSNDNSVLILEFSRGTEFEHTNPDDWALGEIQTNWQGDVVNLYTDGTVNYNPYQANSDYNIEGGNGKVIYNGNNSIRFRLIGGTLNNADVLISVTAQFPD